MFDPAKRLGADEEAPAKKKPALAIAIGFDPKKRLGEDDPEGEEPTKEVSDADEQMDAACTGICKALNVSPSAAPRLRQYMEAFFHAADSKPHAEGEHTDEDETQIEDSKEY